MQYYVYKNTGRVAAYPYLLDVQSDIIGKRNTRVVIPLFPLAAYTGPRADRLTPVVTVAGEAYVVMTHELASIPHRAVGEEVCNLNNQRELIKASIDFLFDGI
ncbi:CcdB family protein [Raoultella terrigena]|uniref:Toxin CcdB n=1 Tax=Raoultella terrigena TaxID=577 RepID=A0A3P8JKC8_RAOTE|nr:CcdB family protein [Raoultella terrigena]VDR23787.1 plasmid maintenance protein CcdB [Raoultella terrigena]